MSVEEPDEQLFRTEATVYAASAPPIAVVGAGPAGSITALVLARAGIAIQLIDAKSFPRVTACGDVLGVRSTTVLHDLGVDDVLDGAQHLVGIRTLDETGRTLSLDRLDPSTAPRPVVLMRERFDAALRDRAITAGAVPVHARVTGLVPVRDGRQNLELALPDGSCETRSFSFVVGADGARSVIARAAGLHPGSKLDQALSIRRYVSPPPHLEPELLFVRTPEHGSERFGSSYHWAFPVDGERWNIGVYACGPTAGRHLRTELDAFHDRLTDRFGFPGRSLDDQVLGGIVRYDFDATRVSRDRIALVGDAAGLSNALLGEGIAHALESGRIVGEALAELGTGPGVESVIGSRLHTAFGESVADLRDRSRRPAGIFGAPTGYLDHPDETTAPAPTPLPERIVHALRRGEYPWASPPPSTPRLFPVLPSHDRDGTPIEVRSSFDRAGKWWRTWENTRVIPASGLAVCPLPRGGALAAAPHHRTLQIEDLHLALCRDPGGITVAEMADCLRAAGLPPDLPAEVFVAHAAASLAEVGLVELQPNPDEPPPSIASRVAEGRSHRTVPLTPSGGSRARTERLEPPRSASAASRPDANPSLIGEASPTSLTIHEVWVSPSPHGWTVHPERSDIPIPPDARWEPVLGLSEDAETLLVPDDSSVEDPAAPPSSNQPTTARTWRAVPLQAIVLSDRSTRMEDRGPEIADLLRIQGDPDRGRRLHLAVRLIETGRVVTNRSGRIDAPLPAAVAALGDVGNLELLGDSAKYDATGLHRDRLTWWLRISSDIPRRRVTDALLAFGLPEPVSSLIAHLERRDDRFIVGSELEGDTERRKIYLPIDDPAVWERLGRAQPHLRRLHEASAISSLSPGDAPPAFIAWKYPAGVGNGPVGSGTITTALYRSRHDPGVTVARAIGRVLPGHPDLMEAARSLVAFDRDPEDELRSEDVEVIDDRGRSSIDLFIEDPRPHGRRIAAATHLAEVAGWPEPLIGVWARLIGRVSITRFIIGLDRRSRPFCSIYTGEGSGR